MNVTASSALFPWLTKLASRLGCAFSISRISSRAVAGSPLNVIRLIRNSFHVVVECRKHKHTTGGVPCRFVELEGKGGVMFDWGCIRDFLMCVLVVVLLAMEVNLVRLEGRLREALAALKDVYNSRKVLEITVSDAEPDGIAVSGDSDEKRDRNEGTGGDSYVKPQ